MQFGSITETRSYSCNNFSEVSSEIKCHFCYFFRKWHWNYFVVVFSCSYIIWFAKICFNCDIKIKEEPSTRKRKLWSHLLSLRKILKTVIFFWLVNSCIQSVRICWPVEIPYLWLTYVDRSSAKILYSICKHWKYTDKQRQNRSNITIRTMIAYIIVSLKFIYLFK